MGKRENEQNALMLIGAMRKSIGDNPNKTKAHKALVEMDRAIMENPKNNVALKLLGDGMRRADQTYQEAMKSPSTSLAYKLREQEMQKQQAAYGQRKLGSGLGLDFDANSAGGMAGNEADSVLEREAGKNNYDIPSSAGNEMLKKSMWEKALNSANEMAQYAQQADSSLLNSAMQFQQRQTQQAQNAMQEATQQQAKQDAQKRQLLSLGLMFATGGASGGAEDAESVAEGAKTVSEASNLASEAGAMSQSMWDKFLNGANSVGKFAWQNTPYYQLGQVFNGRR